ncbi:MAG: trypsin-like peptidase domain-containing protein [Bacteroidia bacterium]|nr:trypsin-like peptidase domain-containing protein [Bacteroidia bacterium]
MKRGILFGTIVLAAFIGAVLGIMFTVRYLDTFSPAYKSIEQRQNLKFVSLSKDSFSQTSITPNFQTAALEVTPAVVHIRTVYGAGNFSLNPLDHYLNPHARSSGSGVIVSDDGFVVTNNHVIEDASSIEVVMNNNQRFYAKVVGTDPTSDLALLKIKAVNLPFVKYGDSDRVTPGEWVLAIGNPFDLNSTVTAGIVSAKARNIGILRDKNNLQVESFIQTDAAVNPGNSGGALVNLKGELIGINSAIATSTGSYAGYSFAIPVSLVKKIMDDLLEFGQVQRGLLGVQITDVTAQLAEDRNLDQVQGVYVTRVNEGSGAHEVGIQAGDVITRIGAHPVSSVSELQEWVARNRPGNSINVTYRRDGKDKQAKATLKNYQSSVELKKKEVVFELGGAQFENMAYRDLIKLNLDGGALISLLKEGSWKEAGIKESFIITFIDKVPVDNVEDLNRILEMKKGGMLVEGVYKTGGKRIYGVDW